MSLRDEIELYTKLSGNDGYHTSISVIGAYLDGYEKGKEFLQLELANDFINRADVIKAIEKPLNKLPSAQPKRGEWIFKTVFPNDESEFPMGYLVCSVCGSHHSNSTPCNYCDNCGARMKGIDDKL